MAATAVVLAGCADQRLAGFRLFGAGGTAAPDGAVVINLPQNAKDLGAATPVHQALRNAFDLIQQKRFAEAREVLAGLGGQLPAGSDLWIAIKCAEAITALRGGEVAPLVAAVDDLDRVLPDRLRPPDECAAAVATGRFVADSGPMPVNAPSGLLILFDGLRSAKAAKPAPTTATR
jgi:hypothetical protein